MCILRGRSLPSTTVNGDAVPVGRVEQTVLGADGSPPARIVSSSIAGWGKVTSRDRSIRFTPSPGQSGRPYAILTYRSSNPASTSAVVGTVIIHVNAPPVLPEASSVQVVSADAPHVIQLGGSDPDASGGSGARYALQSAVAAVAPAAAAACFRVLPDNRTLHVPGGGVVALGGTSIVLVPNPAFLDISISYTLSDGHLLAPGLGVLRLMVSAPPEALLPPPFALRTADQNLPSPLPLGPPAGGDFGLTTAMIRIPLDGADASVDPLLRPSGTRLRVTVTQLPSQGRLYEVISTDPADFSLGPEVTAGAVLASGLTCADQGQRSFTASCRVRPRLFNATLWHPFFALACIHAFAPRDLIPPPPLSPQRTSSISHPCWTRRGRRW